MEQIVPEIKLPDNHVPSFLKIEGQYFEAPDGLIEHSPVCLIGPPGSGKTTTLSLLANRLGERPEHYRPVFIPCRRIAKPIPAKLSGFISQFVQSIDTDAHRRLVLIFDGLDEIPFDVRREFTPKLQHWISSDSETAFVISTRPAAYEPLKLVTLAEIDSGSDAYIKAFVDRTINDPRRAQELYSLIQGNESLRSLAGSPLLLNLLISIFLDYGSIPDKMSDLYSAWTDTVLRRWDKSRGISRSSRILSLAETRSALSAVALQTLESSKVFFTFADWMDAVKHVTAQGQEAARETLHESAIGTGIIVQRGVDAFSFVHLSLQEYFAALALLDQEIKVAFKVLSDSSFSGLELFYVEMTPFPGKFAAHLLDCGDLDGARRVMEKNSRVSLVDKRRLIELAAKKLGVGTVSFGFQEKEPPLDDGKKMKLRELWNKCNEATSTKDKGRALEEFATSFFGEVFEVVNVNRQTRFGEIDLICEVKQAAFWARWPGDCFVECKNQKEKTGVDIANEFAGKCSTVRLALAFLVSVQPLTNPSKERLARSWGEVGTPDMAWLDGSDVAKWLADESDVESLLKRAVRRAGYGFTL